MKVYDYVLVGAGSAGAIIASRLSEDRDVSVFLAEAGGVGWHPAIHVPGGLPWVVHNNALSWSLKTLPEPGLNNRVLNWPRGRVLGGSSAINGMVYVRGQREDYDSWDAPGWSWAGVKPFFEKSVRSADDWRSTPHAVAVSPLTQRHPLSDAFIEAGAQLGLPRKPDLNEGAQTGVGYYDYTIGRRFRASTALAHLWTARRRPNLTVATGHQARRILFDKATARAVEFAARGQIRRVTCRREIIVCAGTVMSPHLLMLSGIGPVPSLRAHGLPVVQDNAHVGQGVQDHLQVKIAYRMSKGPSLNRLINSPVRRAIAGFDYVIRNRGPLRNITFMSGGFAESDLANGRADIQLHFQPMSGNVRTGCPDHDGATLTISQLRPKSRGEIALASADPSDPPLIRANYLTEPSDVDTVVAGLKLGRDLMAMPAMRGFGPTETSPGSSHLADSLLAGHARATGDTQYHPVGGCALGKVVDENLGVMGVSGLRVADASVIPSMVSGNTNAAAMMIGEKAASLVRVC